MSHSILEMFEFKPRLDAHDPVYDKLKQDFPLLGAALVGNYSVKEKKGSRGGTLMVFIEDDQLKWTFHHKIAGITLFGSFPEMVLDLDMVELAMLEKRFDRKNSRRSG